MRPNVGAARFGSAPVSPLGSGSLPCKCAVPDGVLPSCSSRAEPGRVEWGVLASHEMVVEIGGIPIRLLTRDPCFRKLLEDRYSGFVGSDSSKGATLEVDLVPAGRVTEADDVTVRLEDRKWVIERNDFHATWDPRSRRGAVRQSPNPYSIDSTLRIVHTLLLSEEGGFLLHAASGIRNGTAFLFSGLSGAGKTTLSRLAPADVTLLTDEISYVRQERSGYRAYGTPFAGELAKVGENVSARVGALYFLAQGIENRIEAVGPAEAARRLLRNILFFAKDPSLVNSLFDSACRFVRRVPAYRLTFYPDERVWDLIR